MAEFEYYSNRVRVPGQIDEILELIDVCLYILFALEVVVQLESHERSSCLILWAERHHEFLSEFVPRCEAHLSGLHFLLYNVLSEGRHPSTLEVGQGPVDVHLVLNEI
jgi:hypothetical protein